MTNVNFDLETRFATFLYYLGDIDHIDNYLLARLPFTTSPGGFPHYKYFCPTCGKIWATRYFQAPEFKRDSYANFWMPFTRKCSKCGSYEEAAGSLMLSNNECLYLEAPNTFLEYEFRNFIATGGCDNE